MNQQKSESDEEVLTDKSPQVWVGLASRVQYCHYCFSKVNQIQQIALSSPENKKKSGGAIGALANFYMDNYFSNLSELFTKLKKEKELEILLKSTPEQRIALREKLRHVVVHSVDAKEIVRAFNDKSLLAVLWWEDLNVISKYVYEKLKKQSVAFAESFKDELLDVDEYVKLPEQIISIKWLMDESYKHHIEFENALEEENKRKNSNES